MSDAPVAAPNGGALYQEIANQKIKYFKKIANLEKLIEQTRSEKAQLSVIIETQKQNHSYQLQQQEIKHLSTLKEVRDKYAKGEVPLFQEKLESYKSEFSKQSLVISEEAYIATKANPNCSLKEFIQARVYETLQTYQQDLNQN